MDATLNIIIRVAAKQAQQQLAATSAAMQGMSMSASTATTKASRNFSMLTRNVQAFNYALLNSAKYNMHFSQRIAGSDMIKFGKNINWVGRQLTYNFTLPLALAGAGIVKFQKDVEASMVQVRKVYGDLNSDFNENQKELKALETSFELLSTRFGVHQKEVIDIGAAWASAGSAGAGLAENTKATLEVMILGEMEAAEATEALIAIQATWKLSTLGVNGQVSELTDALATMNIVENETGIRFKGLVEVFERSGGAARSAGVSIQELAAFAAALVPATGEAEQAGNALKTIFSRMQNPTKQARDLLEDIGFTVDNPDWLGKSVTQKLEDLAGQWGTLSTAQRSYASSVLASRWQVNRFDVLMADMASKNGYYAKALNAANDEEKRRAIYQNELNTVLDSSPRKWDIMVNSIRNGISNAFQPLLPAIISVITFIARLVNWFAKLDPGIQRMVLLGLVVVAAIGPFLSLIGTIMQLVGTIKVMGQFVFGVTQAIWGLGQAMWWVGTTAGTLLLNTLAALGGVLKFALLKPIAAAARAIWPYVWYYGGLLGHAFASAWATAVSAVGSTMQAIGQALGALFASGWGIAIVAALAAVAASIVLILTTDIEEPVIDAMMGILRGLARFPLFIAQIFQRIIRVIAQAMMIVIDWLSYLNPFQRHSPSLVDNVRAGVAVILSEYEKLTRVPEIVAQALASFSNFKIASGPDTTALRQEALNEKVAAVSAVNPNAGNAAAAMVDDIMALEAILPVLSTEIAAQEIVVARLTAAYDQAEAAVQSWEAKLKAIKDEMSAVSARIDEANDIIRDLASTPLTGMTAMEDQIFANTMAQNALNLKLLEFEKNGQSIDDITSKMAALNGELELIRGDREALRLAGAGSDILGVYDDQIAAIEAQKAELADTAAQVQKIEDHLKRLDIEGRFLELTKSITFDPLLREIDKLVNGVEEMDFQDIVDGITEQQAVVKNLTTVYDELAKAEKAAEAGLGAATQRRDAILAQLDEQQAKLDQLKDAYDSINSLINEMESSMDAYISAVERAKDAAKGAGDGTSIFDAAADANFELYGGDSVLGKEGDLADIEKFNEDLQAEIDSMLGELDLDIGKAFDDIKKLVGQKLGELWALVKEKWHGIWTGAVNWLKSNWVSLLVGAIAGVVTLVFGPAGLAFAIFMGAIFGFFAAMAEPIWNWTWEHIVTPIGNALGSMGGWLMENFVTPFMGVLGALGGFLASVWETVIWPVLEVFGTQLGILWEIAKITWEGIGLAVEMAWAVIQPIWDAIYEVINAFLMPSLEMLKVTFEIAWTAIYLAIKGAWNFIKPIWEWLYDHLFKYILNPIGEAVGIISGHWDAITDKLQKVWDFFKAAWDGISLAVGQAMDGMGALFGGFGKKIQPIVDVLKGLYNGVIKPIMMAIGLAFQTAWNAVIDGIADAINFFGDAFNVIANGINAVASLLGIDSRVSTVSDVTLGSLKFSMDTSNADKMVSGASLYSTSGGGGNVKMYAQGGVVGKMGDVVKGARAIVGEGSNIHPEYVIPTDPRYRQRAKGLYRELGHVFGEDAMGFDNMGFLGPVGDIIGKGASAARSGLSAIGGLIKDKAVSALWAPVKFAAEQALKLIPVKFIKNIGQSILDSAGAWVTGADAAWNEEALRRTPPAPRAGAGSWHVIPQLLNMWGIPYKVLSTFRPGAITRNTGQPSWHAVDRAIDLSGPTGMINYSPKDLLAINKAIYAAYKPQLKELIYGGPGAKNVFRGADHQFSRKLLDEHVNHVHAALARGGFVVPRTPGGSLFRIGEGLHDEAVQVTPLHGGARGDGAVRKEYNFYGDLSFPNITNPDDAERFISNLEALAGK